ncbi:redoxin domain-containing protein [Paenibacillus barcinonensis]|uniref:Redoxin domain-containing protein n=1 Tax=Paenibacillus barcinonensis TaxID=198119 RepID=A0A2V4USN0_PAEBA|nr:redoxin domain-containing protein [Paenibacillus barcinonensis]PYE42139.1 thiol-disulfide isomerase/thioredoxin [Paenibacillus barcinonensis]QKS55060.1 redoxin domain-containing protein [Paenibacillus barcinonensis]
MSEPKPGLNTRRIMTLLIALVALGAGIWAIVNNLSNAELKSSNPIRAGAEAPDFTAVNSKGEQVRLSDYRGKTVMINFWASWCTPCVREMPLVHELAQQHRNDVETLFVNVGESKGTISEFLKSHQFDFPVILDATGKISSLYRITGLPATLLIDQTGQLRHILLGELTEDIPLHEWLKESI